MKIKFYEAVGDLKSLPRTGWVKRGIPSPETIAAHSFRAQFIAYDFAKELGVDPARCALMMLVHDLPEARAGDMTPDCPITPAAKAAQELKAAKGLAKLSKNPEFLSLFEEFEARETLCAQICYDADKLECLLQALEYERAYPQKKGIITGILGIDACCHLNRAWQAHVARPTKSAACITQAQKSKLTRENIKI